MRNLDGPDSTAPLTLWSHQQDDVRDNELLIVHQDGRAVGKTVNVTVLVLHDGITVSNGRTLITTPSEGHLQKIIEEVEEQIFGNEFLESQVAADSKTGRMLITRKPYYQIRWKYGTIQYFRLLRIREPTGTFTATERS